MAINFPDSPTSGQTFTASNRTWTYNGTSWVGSYDNTGSADYLDGIDSSQFLRSDTSDTMTGTLTIQKSVSTFEDLIRLTSYAGNNDTMAAIAFDQTNDELIIRNDQAYATGGIGFRAGGTVDHMFIKSGGYVGIGTTNPTVKLQVDGSGSTAAEFITTNDVTIQLSSSNTWTGIRFNDSGGQNDDLWHNGTYGTFAMGGSGSNVSGKKLHVHGGLSVGSGAAAAAMPTNGILSEGSIIPGSNNTASLGSTSLRWANVYTGDLHLSNVTSQNDIDGTWGDWTIQEGEENLYLINNRSGKKYMFLLKEVGE